MKLIPRVRASVLYWAFVVALGAFLFMMSTNAHAPQKALELLPVMHVVKTDDADASTAPDPNVAAQPANAPELPRTSVVEAAVPPHGVAASKPASDPHALEAQVRDRLAHEGFPNVGVSAGRDGAVYLAGTLFDNSEPDKVDGLVRQVPGVTDVHFTEIRMMKPSGHAYFGTQTGSARNGVEVLRVFRGSPAQAAGIRKGDVIVNIGDHFVRNAHDFRAAVWSQEGGARVPVTIVRNHGHETLEVRLGQAAEMAEK